AISLRHALPWHELPAGIHGLPPNHVWLRLLLVQSTPTVEPSASLPTFETHALVVSEGLYGTSTVKPMNIDHGAWSTIRQKYSSTGKLAPGIGSPAIGWLPFPEKTDPQLCWPTAWPLGFSHGNNIRLPAEYLPHRPVTNVMLTTPARPR